MFSRRKFLTTSGQAACLAPFLSHVPALLAAEPSRTEVLQARCGNLIGDDLGAVRRYRGIPFAKPPVDALRFKAPQPLAPWDGVHPALAFAKAPIQKPIGPSKYVPIDPGYSEDCLYLNVWAPKAPGPHPVYVYIYGGGNIAGTTSMPVFDGEAFARHGVVLVSIAYRVGLFGFMDVSGLLGEQYAGSGNNGLRDQALGLTWVRDNIAAFGGDPERVTIGGQSAGAKDVLSLMAMPAAKGLFHRAISESGGGQTYADLDTAHQLATLVLGKAGGTQGQDLLSLPAAQLLAAQGKVIAEYPRKYPFRAVIDNVVLFMSPLEALAKGMSRDVPLMLGTSKDEQAFFGPTKAAEAPVVPGDLANLPMERFKPVFARYPSLYPQLDPQQLRFKALTAESYWIPSLRLAEARAKVGAKSWLYRFDMLPREGVHAEYSVHGSELALVFDNLQDSTAPALGPVGERGRQLGAVMHAFWLNFIRQAPDLTLGDFRWPVFDLQHRPTMVFDDVPRVVSDLDGAERRLWEEWEA